VELYSHSSNTPSWRGAQLIKKAAQGQLYFLPMGAGHRSTVFGNRVVRGIGYLDVRGNNRGCRKLRNEALQNLFSSNIIRIINLRSM
jgi:hypothetical protein